MALKYKYLINIAVLTGVFLFSIFVWISPALFKGYTAAYINDAVILGRNLSASGEYSINDSNFVLLSSELISRSGEKSLIGNKLTAYIYSYIFKYFGLKDLNSALFVSALFHSLALLIFAATVLYLYGIKRAAVFSLFYIFFPFNWLTTHALGIYEFALFFLSLFFLFFILGCKLKNSAYFFVAGVFLTLAALAREAFIVLIPVVFAYLFFAEKESLFNQKRKIILSILVPVFAILTLFYLPGALKGENIYKDMLFMEKSEKENDFTVAGHLFPDYYTFRYDRENFLNNYKLEREGGEGFVRSFFVKKTAANIGLEGLGLFERAAVGTYLFIGHIGRFFSLEDIGGPFIFVFMLLGFIYLKPVANEAAGNKFLFNFFLFWIFGSLFIISFVVLAGRNHLMDFGFAISLSAALGLFYLSDILRVQFSLNGKAAALANIFLIFTAIYSLFLVDHIVWGKIYDKDILRVYSLVESAKKDVLDNKVIVSGLSNNYENETFHFLSDKSVIIFKEETLKKILSEKKINQVFNDFNIGYIMDFPLELTQEIVKETGIKEIVPLKYAPPKISSYKIWLMNFAR